MRRLIILVLSLLLASSLGLGSAAHASEPITCVETPAASSIGHVDGDADQVPADAEKGYPHHHGGCHGHHVGVPLTPDTVPYTAAQTTGRMSWEQAHGTGLIGDPALRPPRA